MQREREVFLATATGTQMPINICCSMIGRALLATATATQMPPENVASTVVTHWPGIVKVG